MLTESLDSPRTHSKQVNEVGVVPWGGFASLGLGFVTFVIIPIIAALLLDSLYPNFVQKLDSEPNLTNAVFFITLFAMEMSLIYFLVKNQKVRFVDVFKLKAPKVKSLLLSIPVFVAYSIAIVGLLGLVAQFVPPEVLEQEQDISFIKSGSQMELFLVFISLVIITPIIEELIFRGYIFQGFTRRFGYVGAAVISSGLFGLAHLQVNIALDTFVLGLAACWLYVKTKNLWPVIVLHAIKNGIAFVFLFVLGNGG